MRNSRILLPAIAVMLVLFMAGCATTAPAPSPGAAANPNLIDPRIGLPEDRSPAARKFEAAWRLFEQGQVDEAARRLADIERRQPEYRPAVLAGAAIAIQQGNLDVAAELIAKSRGDLSDYTAADVYAGEVAMARGDLKTAWERYSVASREPGATTAVVARKGEVRKQLFDQLFAASSGSAGDEQAIASLREALTIVPESEAARGALVQRLIGVKRYDEARRELDPLFMRGLAERPEVQEALVDIDAGRGRFQDAITRLDRLSRNHPDPRYSSKLQEIKDHYALANMPPQYARAMESAALTRADAAVLIYWTLSSVRFAQNLSQPPIAVDIANVAGREELIRALALRLFGVDPITRTANPNRVLTGTSFVRLTGSLMTLRGTPACGSALPDEPNDLLRAQKLLEACGISTAELLASPEAPVSGKQARTVLEKIENLSSTEKR